MGIPRTGSATVDAAAASVAVHFQQWPGPAGTPIRDLRARAGRRDLLTIDGTVHVPLTGGVQLLELLDPAGGDAVLASYLISTRAGLPSLAGDDCLHGALVRLNHLGYSAGVESLGDGFAGPTTDLERALLTFEADHGLTAEGLTSRCPKRNAGSARIVTRVAEGTKTRLREVTERELGADVPEDAEVCAGGVGSAQAATGMMQVCAHGALRLALVRFERHPPDHLEVTEEFMPGERESVPEFRFPYVDDSGYAHDRGYADGHHGPLVGVTGLDVETDYTVRLVRENLPDDAPLFVESCLPSAVEVSADPLAAGRGCAVRFRVRVDASGGRDERPIDLQVRLGSITGPVIHVLRVLVLRPLDIDVAVIALRFGEQRDYPVTTRRAAALTLARCERLLRQAGLRLRLREFAQLDDLDHDYSAGDEEAGVTRLLQRRHYPDCVNVYVVRDLAYFAGTTQLAAGESASMNPARLVDVLCQPDAFDARLEHTPHVLAHELSHALGLLHSDPDDPNDSTVWFRVTAWAMRRLMFYRTVGPGSVPGWQGAGGLAADHMLSLRDLPGDQFDNEVARLRQRVRSGEIYDGQRFPPADA